MEFTYKFNAIKGIQSKNDYYIAMVPMGLLSKLFDSTDYNEAFPEYRAQRRINELRIPDIKNYILTNRDSYVFSALSASIDGKFKFINVDGQPNLGVLEIDMNAKFLINDGQHRKAAIEEALEEDESLKDETISIVFFKDMGLKRSQQMFTDLNKHAVKTSNSLSTLYNSRDSLAVATKNIINRIDFLKKYTDKEKDNLGKNSAKLFTLHKFYNANKLILNKLTATDKDETFLFNYWQIISKNINEWNELVRKEITKTSIKEDYIITLGVTLLAFGRLGSCFYNNKDLNMEKILRNLKNIDWLRNNKDNWLNRNVRLDGRVMSNTKAVMLTYLKIKQLVGLALSFEEKNIEIKFINDLKIEGNKK